MGFFALPLAGGSSALGFILLGLLGLLDLFALLLQLPDDFNLLEVLQSFFELDRGCTRLGARR